MKTVAYIMTKNVISLLQTDSLYDAHMVFKKNKIRHLPILATESREFVGILDQRKMLLNAFKVVEDYGFSKLEKYESRTSIQEVMRTDCETVPSSTRLTDVGKHFLEKKSGCLPVVDDGHLMGIITSMDFVKLALELLGKSENVESVES